MPMIPFSWWPGHWGLTGDTKRIAEIEYNEDPSFEREMKVAAIRFTGNDLKTREVDLKVKHSMLTDDEAFIEKLKINYTGKALEIELLKLNKDKLSDQEYAKQLATLEERPWIYVSQVAYNKKSPAQGNLELDWNKYFIRDLRAAGYDGETDEDVVDVWLNELCRNVAIDAYSGIGEFDDLVNSDDERPVKH